MINGYEFLEEIGRGQHGKVKKARRIPVMEPEEFFAIKIVSRNTQRLRLGKVQEPENRIRKEIAILKQCRHPNIVSLLEVIDDKELRKAYLVLEFVKRGEVIWRTEGDTNVVLAERQRIEAEMLDTIGILPGGETKEEYRLRTGKEAYRRHQQAELTRTRTMEWSMEDSSADDSGQVVTAFAPQNDEAAAEDSLLTPRIEPTKPSHHITTDQPDEHHHSADPSLLSLNSSVIRDESLLDNRDDPLLGINAFSALQVSSRVSGHPRFSGQEGVNPAAAPGSRISSLSGVNTPEYGARNESPRWSIDPRNRSVADNSYDQLSMGYVIDHFEEDFAHVPCLSMNHARMTFRDTVLGLEYLHYNEIIHRDIKPANLLWTDDKHTKISDFGVSYLGQKMEPRNTTRPEQLDEDRDLARTVGTPAFLAPELVSLESNHRISSKIDLWSLGVTLYCLIFARVPFLANNEFQLFKVVSSQPLFIPRKRLVPVQLHSHGHTPTAHSPVNSPVHQTIPPPDPSTPVSPDRPEQQYEEIGDDLRDLITRLLIKDPDERISLREVKHHRWVLAGLPDPAAWIAQTDPERFTSGHKIGVSDQDLEKAFVPLTIMEKIKSKIGTLGGFLGRSKDRSASSEDRVPRMEGPQGKEKTSSRSRTISTASSTEGSAASTPHGPSGLSRQATPQLRPLPEQAGAPEPGTRQTHGDQWGN